MLCEAENYAYPFQGVGAFLFNSRYHVHWIRDCSGYSDNISLM